MLHSNEENRHRQTQRTNREGMKVQTTQNIK